uniref:Uncharacterized protein n=1 Tax=Astyanax mexicanus TaxID=7994 RepID=A0A3B1JS28_ASTMX
MTLNTLWDLLDSGFGWPSPRHGLNLLYWFANECVEVDNWNQIAVLCDPSSRDFGFRLYHNNEGLLPVTNQPYFEVGNLNHEEARNLPDYVRREYNGYQYNNNADRIIICVDHDSVNRVYVTSHGEKMPICISYHICITCQYAITCHVIKNQSYSTKY